MKHNSLLKKLLTLFSIILVLIEANAQTTGEIAFTAFNGDGDDDFAIVALVDISANSTLYITDKTWDSGTTAFTGSEGILTWETGGSIIEAGTIIVFTDLDNASNPNFGVSVGTVARTSGNFNIAVGGEVVFIYLADAMDINDPTTFITGFKNATLSGTDLTSTGLTSGTNFIELNDNTSPDGGAYTGSRSDQSSYSNYSSTINNEANWSTTTSTGNGEVYLPFTQQAFTLSSSDATWDGSDSGSWSLAANWSGNAVPTVDSNVTIPSGMPNDPTISGSVVAGNVTLNSNVSLTITGTLTNKGITTVNSAASLIASSGTISGNVVYKVNVADTNWHLISPPVIGQQYDDTWNTANSVDQTGQTNTLAGVSTYSNTTDADGDWTYFTIGSASQTFSNGQGYSMLRTSSGDYTFTGTMRTTDASIAITANDIGGAGENRWTLIGNPFPSFMSIDDFLGLAANATALEDSREAVYVWNGTAYAAVTTGYLHPGQGFFVNSNVASTSVAINESMLSHQTGITFYRNANTNPAIELMLSDGQSTRMTEIHYENGKTTGLDPRFDIGTFTGTSNSFHIYSHLISDSNGVDFMRQTLPNADHENLIIPIGVNATSGTEISFTANATNIPNGLNVFIEDRDLGTYTRLDESNAAYTLTLSDDVNGIGRFYLHTNTQSALSTNSFDLNTVNIYKTSETNLRITGLRNGNAALSIYDLLGKQVLQRSFEANSINDITLPNVKTGVYIIRLSTDNGTLNKKIVLNN